MEWGGLEITGMYPKTALATTVLFRRFPGSDGLCCELAYQPWADQLTSQLRLPPMSCQVGLEMETGLPL